MKLPIRRVPGSVPPRFEYYTIVNLLSGGTQAVKSISAAPPGMEAALCDLLRIAEQLAKENAVLKEERAPGSGRLTAQYSEEGPVAGTLRKMG